MNILPLIEAKRDGRTLTASEIRTFISRLPEVPDYQVSAFLMAVFFRGLDAAETSVLTLAMRDSGDGLSFPDDPRPLVDKHSTGGVGDKVSLPLAPLLACLGFRVPMISGRALGITGGTLDKLESIPGFTTALSKERAQEIVQEVGCVICGQTDHMVPADKRLYALRDVTGTVPSIPLITASILSKKLAERLDALLLDVKFGCAAFMRTREEAAKLAESMVALGRESGVNMRALLTDMNTPLGRAVGNWLEVKESVACLEGHGPPDLRELVIAFAAHLLLQTRRTASPEAASQMAAECLDSGAPRRKWDEMLQAQRADQDAFARRLLLDHPAPVVCELRAERGGYVSKCDARIIGELIRDLGGGRVVKESTVDPEIGVDRLAKPGDMVGLNATLARVHLRDKDQLDLALSRLRPAFEIVGESPPTEPLICQVV